MSKRIIAGALAGAVLASTMAPMGVYADSPEVNIWVSKVNATDSGMEKGLEKQTPVHFGSGDSASTNNLIVVDENNTYQTVDGFGASITEASAHLYQTNLNDSAKAAAMQALFDKESGIGLSMLRQTIGASDHCVAPYNFAPDEQDDSLPNWDFSHELIEIMPTVQDALAVEPGRITVMASCWSPPGWMKETDKTRYKDVKVRIPEEELAVLNCRVAKTGMSREQYIRCLIADTIPAEYPPADYRLIIRKLDELQEVMEVLVDENPVKRDAMKLYITLQNVASTADVLRRAVMPFVSRREKK